MPRADDFCHFELANNPTLTDRNPLGVKGVGEAGTLGAIPAVMNAVNDALARIGAPRVESRRPRKKYGERWTQPVRAEFPQGGRAHTQSPERDVAGIRRRRAGFKRARRTVIRHGPQLRHPAERRAVGAASGVQRLR